MRKMTTKGQPFSSKSATNKMVAIIEENECRTFLITEINKAIAGRRYLSLRQAAKESRFLWILVKWRDSLATGDVKDQEYWGSKIEEYCMEKAPSNLKVDGMEGANLLMEVVAKALLESKQKKIAHDTGRPGQRSD